MEIRITKDQDRERMEALLTFLVRTFPECMRELNHVVTSARVGVEVEVKALHLDRTRDQENYYRKYVRLFAHYCGMTEDEMHEEMLCQTFGGETVSTKFGPRRRPTKRSSDTNTKTYSMLVETLIRIAGDMGYAIPPPGRPL